MEEIPHRKGHTIPRAVVADRCNACFEMPGHVLVGRERPYLVGVPTDLAVGATIGRHRHVSVHVDEAGQSVASP
jgi:hypothetical protein